MTTSQVSHNILVVEDEWLIAVDMEMMIQDAAYTVSGPAANVAAALRLIDKNDVDAAFLDVTLGSEDSFPIANVLHAAGIPFTFVSAYTKSDLPDRYREFDLLQKPVSFANLSNQIKKMLQNTKE